jgi:hypothetical protein
MMGRVIEENHFHWTDHLPFIMAAYRYAVHRSTGYSPNFLMFGREVYTPLDFSIKAPSKETVHSDTYVDKQLKLLSDAYWRVRKNLYTSLLTNKRYCDEAAHKLTFSVGDWVWFHKPRPQTGKYP